MKFVTPVHLSVLSVTSVHQFRKIGLRKRAPSLLLAAGPGAGRQNYSKAKVHCLLKVVETLLPIGADMWSAVEASFSKQTLRQDVLL